MRIFSFFKKPLKPRFLKPNPTALVKAAPSPMLRQTDRHRTVT